MKLHSQHVELLADAVVKRLTGTATATFAAGDVATEKVQNLITEDLEVEDRLNEEVREILAQREGEMRSAGIQYHEMFKLVKQKLARERKLIL